ncbi:hypothetical protein G0U57_017945 [Chelydra serpentina]|uniref:Uncharacterized protein n=1 Tax=Chelydra serpentina TaxID=8475 RepID=A0A8T1S624_CHESE|nr:hypothetical protein G0U57_017945 [Chelydra serpentina]
MADSETTVYQEQVTYTIQITDKEDIDEEEQRDGTGSVKFSSDNNAGSKDEINQPQRPVGSDSEETRAALQRPVEKEASQSRTLGKAKVNQVQQTDSSVSVYKRKELMDNAQQTDPGSEKTSRTILGQQSWHGSQQSLKQLSQHSRKSSRETREQVQAVGEVYAEEGVIWISPRTSREMTNKSQQTSLVWSRKALSELLKATAQKSQSRTDTVKGEANGGEDRISLASVESDAQVEQPTGQESRRSSQKPTGQESRRSSQQPVGQESRRSSQQPIDRVIEEVQQSRRPSIVVIEKAQQTYSVVSLEGGTWINRRTGKIMMSNGQQTSDTWIQKFSVTAQPPVGQESRRGSGASGGVKVEPQEPSGLGSGETHPDAEQLKGEESWHSCQQLIGRESQRSIDIDKTAETEAREPTGPESEEPQQKPSKIKFEKAQQTYSIVSLEGGSWINRRTGKVMTSHSQQTSDTWIQKFTASAQQPVGQESRRSSDTAKGGMIGTPEATSRRSVEAEADLQQPLGQESWHSVDVDKAEEMEAQQPVGSESKETLQSRTSSIEVIDEVQQTYSIVSLEEGTWINRKTGKILMSHSQQTSHTSIRKLSATAQKPTEQESRRSSGIGEEFMLEDQQPAGLDGDGTDVEVQPLPEQESRRSSQKPTEQEFWRDSDVAKTERNGTQEPTGLVSEQTLPSYTLSTEVIDEGQPIYRVISQEEGTWINRKTGKLVKSKSQQTNETCIQQLKEEQEAIDQGYRSSSYAAGEDLIEIPEPPFCGSDERDAAMMEASGPTCAGSDEPDAELQQPEERESL